MRPPMLGPLFSSAGSTARADDVVKRVTPATARAVRERRSMGCPPERWGPFTTDRGYGHEKRPGSSDVADRADVAGPAFSAPRELCPRPSDPVYACHYGRRVVPLRSTPVNEGSFPRR